MVLNSLLADERFIRVHRSFLVNLDNITCFSRREIYMGTEEIPFGRNYQVNWMEFLAIPPNDSQGLQQVFLKFLLRWLEVRQKYPGSIPEA